MNISFLTIIGMIAALAGNFLTFLLNREKMVWPLRLLLAVVTVAGLVMVGFSNHDLNENLGKLQAESRD